MRSARQGTTWRRLKSATIFLAAALALATTGLGSDIRAEEPDAEIAPPRPTTNNYGITGLIEMPSAEVQPDAQITVTTSFFSGFLRNQISATILPGVEAAFRYSALGDLGTVPGQNTLFDRSFDIKVRLVEESRNWPSIAIGLQDFLGTGIFAGEYIVATKSFLDGDLKLTGGVGWGRFASVGAFDNPLTELSDRFNDRTGAGNTGGNVNFGEYFSGPNVGVFAGVQWRTPIEGLTVTAEYASDDYDFEDAAGAVDVEVPINLGLSYRPLDGVEVGAYYMYGSEFGVRVSLSANPFKPLALTDGEAAPQPLIERPAPPNARSPEILGEVRELFTGTAVTTDFTAAGLSDVSVEERLGGVRWAEATVAPSAGFECPANAATAIDAEYGVVDAVTFRHPQGRVLCTVALRPAGQQAIRLTQVANSSHPTDWHGQETLRQQVVEALVAELDADELGLFGIDLSPTRAEVYIENTKFRSTPRAIGRTARALSRTMPPSVETFEIIVVESSLPVVAVSLTRSELEDQVNRPDAARRAWLAAEVADARPIGLSEIPGVAEQYPRFTWGISPAVPVNLFDPDQPARFDLSVVASAGIEFLPGLSINGDISQRIIGQLDDIERDSDSVLPRVRSDFAEYLREGEPAITRLTGDYITKLDDDIYGRFSVGLLERMFGGVSAEVLWKPANQSWGIGAEVNWTQQRDFDTLFSFQDYQVATGHVSLYWDTPWYGISTQIDAGRYLARDLGATLTVKRRFANGWEFGGFATFTNVPFNEFGEGSFDKGLFLTIPLNWALPFESRSEFSTVLRPLTRDGGQRLIVSNRLYPIVEDFDRQHLRANWGSFWE
ncbi:MAG: YjbH domain-containing protein [Pseudomonadota bacterium]